MNTATATQISLVLSPSDVAGIIEKVSAFNKLAAKYGVDACVELVIDDASARTITERTEFGWEISYEVFDATFTGTNFVLPGNWTLAGTLDHDVEGNIFRTNPHFAGEIPAEFRGTDAERCDHCNTRRRRNQTVLVWNEADGFKQVGSDCVRLFLGIAATSVLRLAEALGELREGEAYGRRASESTSAFIAAASVVTETYGFRPSSWEGPSTKSITAEWLSHGHTDSFRKDFPELSNVDDTVKARANKLAVAATVWIGNEAGNNEYILNLKIAAKRDLVGNNAGLLASLPNAFKRATEAQIARDAKVALPASEFVGTVGSKVSVKATVVYTNRTEAYSYHGPEGLFLILLADDGSKFYVNTTVATAIGELLEDAEKGTYFTVIGTVKAHKVTGKDEKVTVLTRCKAVAS